MSSSAWPTRADRFEAHFNAFFSFVGNRNKFFLPYLVLPNSEQLPFQVGLSQPLMLTGATKE
jgi:ABC-type glycerol-3-phosphate transport system permease component